MTRESPLDGVLLVDKPEGPTSFDVVRRVRRALRVGSAGHAGTLDPMATGLLVVCLGEATRLAGFLTEGDKEYLAEVALGQATDTFDRTGRVVAEADASGVDEAALAAALECFRGPLSQQPPMFSAVRVDGERLYERARRGEEVERAARPVVVHALELLAFEPPRLRLKVRCSKGTYVRSLAHELGEALGCHGHLTALRRVGSGRFRVEEALPLEAVERLAAEVPQQVAARLVGESAALDFWPALTVAPGDEAAVGHGQRLGVRQLPEVLALAEGTRVRLLSGAGRLLALAQMQQGRLNYLRVLAPPSS